MALFVGHATRVGAALFPPWRIATYKSAASGAGNRVRNAQRGNTTLRNGSVYLGFSVGPNGRYPDERSKNRHTIRLNIIYLQEKF